MDKILGRARYCEDMLAKAIASGIGQYLIIGAGLDSFALRHPELAPCLTVFELDHPASQGSKRRRVVELTGGVAENLVLVPVDFERETVADALRRSSFAPTEPAFVSWLGTRHYLSAEAVYATLSAVGQYAAKGSEIVFDYGVRGDMLAVADRDELETLKRFVAERGEPFASSFDPVTITKRVAELGFTLVEDLSHEQQMNRYFADRPDGLSPAAFSRIAHFRRDAPCAT